MAELFEAVASWQTLLLVMLVFGFAPGFVLRLLVLAYPRSDPRRRELIAELYAVPRIQRPLWVAEELKVTEFLSGLSAPVKAHSTLRMSREQLHRREVARIDREAAKIYKRLGPPPGWIGGSDDE